MGYLVLLVLVLLLLSSGKFVEGTSKVCKLEQSEVASSGVSVVWRSSVPGEAVISVPPCIGADGRYVIRECVADGWEPKEPPNCASTRVDFICPSGYIHYKDKCLLVSPLSTFDVLCPYPGVRYYNHSNISSNSTYWMPIKKVNSTFIYASIDRRYGMEFKTGELDNSKGCFVKNATDIYSTSCTSLHHHICLYRVSQFNKTGRSISYNHTSRLQLVLQMNQKKQQLILKVYHPEDLLPMTDDRGYAVYCFTDAAVNEMKTKVKKKLKFNSLLEAWKGNTNILVYEISLKHEYPGQYWCEAYDTRETLSRSNTIIGSKKQKGHEYSIRLVLHNMCGGENNCSTISTAAIYEYLKQKQFQATFAGIDFSVRVMYIYGKKGEFDVDVLLHVSTQRDHNFIGEYYRIAGILHQLHHDIEVVFFRSSEYCLPERTDRLYWKLTAIGNQQTPQEFCIGTHGFPVVRACTGDFLEGAYWGSFEQCDYSVPVTIRTQSLYNMTISSDKLEVVEGVKNLTVNAGELSALDVYFVANALNNITIAPDNDVIVDDLIETFEHILEGKADVLKASQLKLNSTDILLDTIDTFLRNEGLLNRLENDVFMINKSQVFVHITKPFLSNISGIAVYDNGNGKHDSGEVVNMNLNATFDDLHLDDLLLSVYLPVELLETLVEGTEDRENLTVITTVFYNDKLFNSDDNETTSGIVISVTIPGYGLYLKEPIPLLFRNNDTDKEGKCSFWDYGTNAPDRTGRWSQVGGSSVANDSYSECSFSHLTHFALLIMSRLPLEGVDEILGELKLHSNTLSIITYVGSSLSLIGLFGIFLTAICFRKWRIKVGSKILLQLSLTIALELIILQTAGLEHINGTETCIIIGIGLHYVVLSTFSWMFVSAVLQYVRFVKVLSVLPPRLVFKTMIVGWLAPLLPVVLVASIFPSNYSSGSQNFCYPSGLGLYLGLFAPVVLIVTANFIVFCLIMRNVFQSRVDIQARSKRSQKLQIYLGILLFFMLGIPWVFGILAEMLRTSHIQILFIYLFCATATLQGFVLFIFYIILNRDTRNLWAFALFGITRKN